VSWEDPGNIDQATGRPYTAQYYYQRFSTMSYTFGPDDYVTYDVRVANPSQGLGGLDVTTADGAAFRDQVGWADQRGLSGHPATDLRDVAYQQWYHRSLKVPSSMVGRTAAAWTLAADLADLATVNQGRGTSNVTEATYRSIVVTDAAGTPRPGGVVFDQPGDAAPGPAQKKGTSGRIESANATDRQLGGTDVTGSLRFPSERRLIASVNATAAPYNAPHDGVTDASTAVQKAIDDVYDQGGGTVFLPAGRYAMTHRLVVRAGVLLAGDWKSPATWAGRESGDLGTVLAVTADEGNESAPPFLQLAGSISGGAVSGLTIWYPNQTMPANTGPGAVIKYPWTIQQELGSATSIERVTLVNSYRGLELHALAVARQIYGAPLMTGISVADARDVSRLRDIDLSYHYWGRSGLPGAPDPAADRPLLDWKVAQPSVGISFSGTDGQDVAKVTVDGFATGVAMVAAPAGGSRAFWGVISGLHVENAMVALQIDRLGANIGGSVVGSILRGWKAGVRMTVQAATDSSNGLFYDKPFSISSSTLSAGVGPAVQLTGNSALMLDSNRFDRWASGGVAVDAQSGSIVVRRSYFAQSTGNVPAVRLGSGVRSATILDNGFADGPGAKPVDSAQGIVPGRIEVASLAGTVTPSVTPVQYSGPDESRYLPGGPTLYDVRIPIEGCSACPPAVPDGRTDNTAAIQSRLDFAGAHGGGTVYLPGGHYLVAGVLTVPAGVELRGAVDAPQYADVRGTILLTTHQGDQPFITLGGGDAGVSGGGVRALKVFWPNQARTASGLIRYPWAIASSGAGVHVANVTLVNAFRGVRFDDGANDHFVRSLFGLALEQGISVGRTTRGWLEDTHFIRTAWTYSQLTRAPETTWNAAQDSLHSFTTANLVGYQFHGTSGEQLLNPFVLEVRNGFVADGATVTAVNAGNDQSSGTSYQVRGGATVRFSNVLATGFTTPGADYVTIDSSKAVFDGVLLWNTSNPTKGVHVTGDSDVTLGAGVMTSGGIRLDGGRTRVYGLLLRPDPVVADPGAIVTVGLAATPGTAVDGTLQGRGVAVAVAPGGHVLVRGNVIR
jgi:hypothetical protein